MSNENVKHERWFDEEGKFLDVYWMDKEDKKEAVVFGYNNTKGTKMNLEDMENKGFHKG